MEPITELSFSVLVTREEYSEAAAQHRRLSGRKQGTALTAAGAVLAVLGIAGIFFGSRISLSFSASFSLIVLGVFLACYNGVLAPLFRGAEAAREYDAEEDLHFATVYRFTPEAMEVKNGRMEGTIPLRLVTRWAETPSLFTLSVGREFRFALPKRLMEPEQAAQLAAWLKDSRG